MKLWWDNIKASVIKAHDKLFGSEAFLTVLRRLRQPSTRRGLAALFSLMGIAVSPDAYDLYFEATLFVLGMLAVASDEDVSYGYGYGYGREGRISDEEW